MISDGVSPAGVITISAPDGVGEVRPGADLAALLLDALAAQGSADAGPEHGTIASLRDGDIVVVTSKIVSKAEDRYLPAEEREAAISAESVRTVAQRGPTRIVRTRLGLTIAAAGVDNSNVEPESVLLLPLDPDASAARLRDTLETRAGARLGVIISDTAGRAWRIGQTDQAIGAAGVTVADSYAGLDDPYGNPLRVTIRAVADEVAAAADLAKGKLDGRPFAIIRGLGHLVGGADERATTLNRPAEEDMFSFGSREAVLAAVLEATGQPERFEDLVGLDPVELAAAVLAGPTLEPAAADLVRRMLTGRGPQPRELDSPAPVAPAGSK